MMINMSCERVRHAFSNAAIHYDVLAGMQYRIGRRLIKDFSPPAGSARLLDIGMGTGRLTCRMSRSWPGQKIVGIDFADGMVQEARRKYANFDIVQAHAGALPFRDASFDGVFSNLALQWVGELTGAFGEARRVLKRGGELRATMFGEGTLPELFMSLDKTLGVPRHPWRRLRDRQTIQEALMAAGFCETGVRCETVRTHFEDLAGLLRWLKMTGANRVSEGFYLGPRSLSKISEYYQDHFQGRRGIVASFEVVWVKGKQWTEKKTM